jgi:hypothetical protein
MWKAILDSVLESLVYMDPMAYCYYVEAKRIARLQAEATRNESSDDAAVVRLVERLQARPEASVRSAETGSRWAASNAQRFVARRDRVD